MFLGGSKFLFKLQAAISVFGWLNQFGVHIFHIINRWLLFMIKTLLLTFSLFVITTLQAQNTGSITGKLIDSVGKQTLKAASISIMDANDSTVLHFGLSKEKGDFLIRNIPFGFYLVQMSFQGYKTESRKVTINEEQPLADLGNIYLKFQAKELDEVVVQASPIVVKNDTIQYNASSFKTKPNAVVEDLLKKLPGVIVDNDGNVTAQGEAVQRIFVDGKRFFGNDPKMATKNLPPDIVDKIQVYDAMSDQSAFSGFDDGTRIKTINITTKKSKKRGYFGRAFAADGDQGRYEENVNFSKFRGDQKITALGQTNNINVQGFTPQDGGGSGQSRGGITVTKAAGFNFADTWNGKTDFSGSYFYNNLQTEKDTKSFTQKFLPNNDTSSFTNSVRTSNQNSENNRVNLNIEQTFDSMNMLIIRPDISFQNTNSINHTISNTNKSIIYGTDSISQNNLNQISTGNNKNFNGNISTTFRHRFKAPGHTFSISLNGSANHNNNAGTNNSITNYFIPVDSTKVANQINSNLGNSNSFGSNFSYTFPIALNNIIELSYGYNFNNNTSNTKTLAFDSITNGYTDVVDSLSNNFVNNSSSNRGSIGYRLKLGKINFGISNGVQFTNLTSTNTSKDTSISRSFTNMYPTANFTYTFSKQENLRINYNGRSNQPSISQLQPVPNNSNPANIITGNPNLVQEFSHSIRMLYTYVDPVSFRNISILFNGGLTSNKVVTSITQLANGYQTTTYENMNGTFNLKTHLNYGIQLQAPKSNLNFITNAAYNRDISLINNEKNYTNTSNAGESINWTMNIHEKLDLNINAGYNYNIVKYSIKPQNNRNYYTESFNIEPTYTFPGDWVLGSTFNYSYNSGLAGGYNSRQPLWNASLAKELFDKKQGEIKIGVYDLLNQNVSVSRNVTNNYIQDVQNNVLKRYFLVTFTYNLKKFPGSAKQLDKIINKIMDTQNNESEHKHKHR